MMDRGVYVRFSDKIRDLSACAYLGVHTKPRDWDSFRPDGIIRIRSSEVCQGVNMLM